MSNPLDKLKFARALRAPDEAHVKRVQQHFEAQSDLHTVCPQCKNRIRGTLAELKAHKCNL